MKISSFTTGHLLMFTSTLLSSLNYVALKHLMPTWLNGFDTTFFRIIGATILFWLTSLIFKKYNTPIDKEDRLMIFLGGLLGLFPCLFFFNLAIQYSSIIDVSMISTTPPVVVVIVAAIVDKTKITFMNGVGLFLAIAGAIFLILIRKSNVGSGRDMMGNIFAIISSCAYTFFLFSLRKCSNKYQPTNLLRWVFLSACIGAIPLGFIFAYKAPIVQHPNTIAILILLFVIFFPSFLAYLVMPPAIKRIGQQLVSMYQNLLPILTTILALILHMDRLYWDQPVAEIGRAHV